MDLQRQMEARPVPQPSKEDWSGISNQKKRRKLQNRLNQRAHRERKRISDMLVPMPGGDSPASSPLGHGSELVPIEHVHILRPDSKMVQVTMRYLERVAYSHYQLGSPRTDLLLHLVQLNFTRALMENIKIFGLTSESLEDEAVSPFNVVGPQRHDPQTSLPVSLRPTMVQSTMIHHPWLDLLPSAQMRDNLIRAGESYDDLRLCLDMKGCRSVGGKQTGLIVWGEPWDPSGWEVTEPFAREWSWVVWGCQDLFRSTNYWRQRRGERPLFRLYGGRKESKVSRAEDEKSHH